MRWVLLDQADLISCDQGFWSGLSGFPIRHYASANGAASLGDDERAVTLGPGSMARVLQCLRSAYCRGTEDLCTQAPVSVGPGVLLSRLPLVGDGS